MFTARWLVDNMAPPQSLMCLLIRPQCCVFWMIRNNYCNEIQQAPRSGALQRLILGWTKLINSHTVSDSYSHLLPKLLLLPSQEIETTATLEEDWPCGH